MIEPKCRLTLASKCYGGIFGGGGSSPSTINPSQEYSKILNLTQQKTIPFYQNFIGSNPNIQAMQGIAGQQLSQLPALESNLLGAYGQEGQNIPWAQEQIRSAYGAATPVGQLTGPLMQTYQNYLTPILQSGGQLAPDMARIANQQAASQLARSGMVNTMPGSAQIVDYLNRQREQRYATTLGQAEGLTGSVSGLDSEALKRALAAGQGVTGYDQLGMQNALGLNAGLLGLQAGTQQGLANPLNTGIAAFTQLLNPASATVSSATNFNANAAQAAANNKSNTQGALIGAGAKVASAYAGG